MVALALLVVAASAIAALASSGGGLIAPVASLHPDWLRVIRLGAVAAVALGLAGLVVFRERGGSGLRRDEGPAGGALLKAAAIMALVAVLTLFRPPVGPRSSGGDDGASSPPESGSVRPDMPSFGERPPPPPTSPLTDGFSPDGSVPEPEPEPPAPPPPSALEAPVDLMALLGRVGLALLGLLVLGLIVTAYMAATGRWVRPIEPEEEDEEEPLAGAPEAEVGILASLEEIARPGGDPRMLITAAYQRLLAALADAGAPREPHEAPHEHLNRALGPLGVTPEPLHRLAALYVVAQFSEHPVTEAHRRRAAEALQISLADLRARADRVEVGT